MYKVATIFLFLFLFSCTVTKRVHRPGFHVEWKKNYKVQKDDSNAKVIDARGDISASLVEESGLEFEGEVQNDKSLPNDNIVSNAEALEARVSDSDAGLREPQPAVRGTDSRALSRVERRVKKKKSTQSFNLKQQAHSFFIEKTRKYAPLKMPKAKKNAVSNSGGGAGEGFLYLGYILLGIGGYILIGALLSFFGFWLMEELFYSLVFSGNGIIAGILGFILFLAILLVVFIAYAIVHYLLGGAYMGFIVSLVFIGAGLLCLLVWACL